MIPLCCSQKSGKIAMQKGARFDENKKIFYIDNRHKRDNFFKWLPRYYRPSNDKNNEVIKIYYCPYSSPARNLKELIGNEKFFKLKTKINLFTGGVCQFCGKQDNLWVVCLYKSQLLKNGTLLKQELTSCLGACPECAKLAIGYSKDVKKLMFLNKWTEEKAKEHVRDKISKNQKIFEKYEIEFETKINQILGV